MVEKEEQAWSRGARRGKGRAKKKADWAVEHDRDPTESEGGLACWDVLGREHPAAGRPATPSVASFLALDGMLSVPENAQLTMVMAGYSV